jgi:predicted ArsR family transcriptional regulator
VKFPNTILAPRRGPGVDAQRHGEHVRTRDAVARLILESGPRTAAELAQHLNISPAAVRRHLDALVAEGLLEEREARVSGHRGRGRPPRAYALTDAGRAAFPHGYDDLATMAVRFLRESGGEKEVGRFAERRAESLAGLVSDPSQKPRRVGELAEALTTVGYASTTERAGAGLQLCQHHCPVAHVAAEFPQLCEAETRAFERVLGTYVQRLATIARGDGVCTTYIPDPPEFHGANR